MKRKIIYLVVIGISICSFSTVNAQQKFKFSSQNYIGIVEGESGTALQLQTINGFRYKTWFTGIGTGIDYYFQRSIPLFVSLAKSLPAGKLPFYFDGAVGVNFPWVRNNLYYFENPGAYSPSLYWSGGVGYKLKVKNKDQGVLLNFGYSYKHLINETEYTVQCLVPPCDTYTEKYDYRLKRLSLKIGWLF